MCEWGDSVLLRVPIPADLSHTGEARWAEKGIDRCIAPLVAALNEAGVYTRTSCCGHGKEPGSIMLADGRELTIEGDPFMPETIVPQQTEAQRKLLSVACWIADGAPWKQSPEMDVLKSVVADYRAAQRPLAVRGDEPDHECADSWHTRSERGKCPCCGEIAAPQGTEREMAATIRGQFEFYRPAPGEGIKRAPLLTTAEFDVVIAALALLGAAPSAGGTCAVCAGDRAMLNGDPCICGGAGTAEAEASGLRRRLYEVERAGAAPAERGGRDEALLRAEGTRAAQMLMDTVKITGPESVVAHFRKHVELAFADALTAAPREPEPCPKWAHGTRCQRTAGHNGECTYWIEPLATPEPPAPGETLDTYRDCICTVVRNPNRDDFARREPNPRCPIHGAAPTGEPEHRCQFCGATSGCDHYTDPPAICGGYPCISCGNAVNGWPDGICCGCALLTSKAVLLVQEWRNRAKEMRASSAHTLETCADDLATAIPWVAPLRGERASEDGGA